MWDKWKAYLESKMVGLNTWTINELNVPIKRLQAERLSEAFFFSLSFFRATPAGIWRFPG